MVRVLGFLARVLFDPNLMAVAHQNRHAVGREGDAVFLQSHLARQTNQQGVAIFFDFEKRLFRIKGRLLGQLLESGDLRLRHLSNFYRVAGAMSE